MQHEPRSDADVIEIHQEVSGLLRQPGLDRVLCGSENPDPAATVLDDDQDVRLGTVEQVGGEEVQRQDRWCLRSQEFGPARTVAAGRGAGPIPASLRICQTVDGATVTPSTSSSPWTRR